MTTLLVAIPVCHKDSDLVLRNLERCIQLDQKCEHEAIVSWDTEIGEDRAKEIIAKAERYFSGGVMTFSYDLPPCNNWEWPRPQNMAWQNLARHLEATWLSSKTRPFKANAWLWWESDALPVKAGWVETLALAYEKAKTPFFGHIVEGRGHMNGVAIYPFAISNYVEKAMLVRQAAFDVTLSEELRKSGAIGCANDYIAHVLKRSGGDAPEPQDLQNLAPTIVLYHGAKAEPMRDSITAAPGEKPSLIQLLAAKKAGNPNAAFAVNILAKPQYSFRLSIDRPSLWHVTERHKTENKDAERRTIQAEASWLPLYKRSEMRPAHLWRYPRSSASLGDKRGLPYLKDVFAEGLTRAEEHDIIVWTNDDTILSSDAPQAVLAKLTEMDACASFRVNFPNAQAIPKLTGKASDIAALGKSDLGRDLIAVRASWLKRHWHTIPDMILGEVEFDLVLSVLIRKTFGIVTTKRNISEITACEMERGYVLHEAHPRSWASPEFEDNPAKQYNRKLAAQWYTANGHGALIA